MVGDKPVYLPNSEVLWDLEQYRMLYTWAHSYRQMKVLEEADRTRIQR